VIEFVECVQLVICIAIAVPGLLLGLAIILSELFP